MKQEFERENYKNKNQLKQTKTKQHLKDGAVMFHGFIYFTCVFIGLLFADKGPVGS